MEHERTSIELFRKMLFNRRVQIILSKRSSHLSVSRNQPKQEFPNTDRSVIRTHASEDTAALTQRLRPLGHPATCRKCCTQVLTISSVFFIWVQNRRYSHLLQDFESSKNSNNRASVGKSVSMEEFRNN